MTFIDSQYTTILIQGYYHRIPPFLIALSHSVNMQVLS